jgi:hypothetical protein
LCKPAGERNLVKVSWRRPGIAGPPESPGALRNHLCSSQPQRQAPNGFASARQNRVETDGLNPKDRWFESVFLRRRVHLTGAFVAAGANAATDQRLIHADGRARVWGCRRDGARARRRHAGTLDFQGERPTELHVRRLQREEQLPGRRSAQQMSLTPVLVPAFNPWRNPEHGELLLSDLRLAAGETQ